MVSKTFDGGDEFNPSLPALVRQLLAMSASDWEEQRQTRIALNWRYYKNEQYEKEFLAKGSDFPAAAQQQAKQLWEGIKPLFNICTMAADVDRDITFANAKPLPFKRDVTLYDRLQGKWDTDRWGRRMRFAPFYGSVVGDSYPRVVEGYLGGEPEAPSRLQVYTPEVMSVLHAQGEGRKIIGAKIEFDYIEDMLRPSTPLGTLYNFTSGLLRPGEQNAAAGLTSTEQQFTKTIIITEEAYYTFRDHRLYAYGDMGNSWANRLGVVPVFHVPFIDIGEACGLPTYHNIIPTLDSVNSLLSFTGQIFKMNADPLLMGYGIKPGTISVGTTDEGTTVLYIPLPVQQGNLTQTPPRLEYLTWDAAGVGALLDFLKGVKEDCEDSIPEMQLKKSTVRTGSGFESSLDKQLLEHKLRGVRATHFEAAEDALQLGLVADDVRGETISTEEMQTRLEEARTNYDLTIYADPILPRDRTSESQMRSVDIADGVLSAYRARLERGMSFVEADEEEKRIEAEHQIAVRRAKEMALAQASVNMVAALPPGNRPNNNRAKGKGAQPTPPTKPTQPQPGANSRTAGQPGTRGNNPKG